MPYLVQWTENAALGLQKLHEFLASHSSEAAMNAMRIIQEKVRIIEEFPNAGKPVEDMEPEYRELLIPFGGSGFVLIYAVQKDSVLVLAIKHQKEAGY